MYSRGKSEEITGKVLLEMASRHDVVIATKVFFPVEKGKNRSGLSRKHVLEACDASLRRLGTDFIDLYQIHRWDDETPAEEVMDVLDALVRAGKVRYLGEQHGRGSCGPSPRKGAISTGCPMQNHHLAYREERETILPVEGLGPCLEPARPRIPLRHARGHAAAHGASEERRVRDNHFGS
jgi:hypothetical protein